MNREIEANYSHKNYFVEWGPRRNRLTHSLLFEEFEMVVERWQDLDEQFKAQGIYYTLIFSNFLIQIDFKGKKIFEAVAEST